jgi:trimeric autotransporter adhesin
MSTASNSVKSIVAAALLAMALVASGCGGGGGGNRANVAPFSGAAYVFARAGAQWSPQAYVKATNADSGDLFGQQIALSSDGNTLAVGARREASNAMGIGGDHTNDSDVDAGAVYVYVRSGVEWSVSGPGEASTATGVGGDQRNNAAPTAGATYVF